MSSEDEFIYVVEGELVLIGDDGEETLATGTCAGFPGRTGERPSSRQSVRFSGKLYRDRHPLAERALALPGRRSGSDVKSPADVRFTHRDGEPYET